jgi:hypothetical protein
MTFPRNGSGLTAYGSGAEASPIVADQIWGDGEILDIEEL